MLTVADTNGMVSDMDRITQRETEMTTYRMMYIAGAWLVFDGDSPRSSTRKIWFPTKLEAVAFCDKGPRS